MATRQLIATFAPQVPANYSVALIDPWDGHLSWVSPDRLQKDSLGAAGICSTPFGYVVGFRKDDERSGIYLFDEELNLLDTYFCQYVRGIHSLMWWESALYAVSTANDAIYRMSFDRRNRICRETLFWALDKDFRKTDSPGNRELFHINSIARHNGRIAVSLFGEPGWMLGESGREMISGKVIFTDNNETVMHSLNSPHSLQVLDGRFVVCEATAGRLTFQSGRSRELRGYLRGLTADETYIYAAANAHRVGGIIQAFPYEGSAVSPESHLCEIFVLDRSSLKLVHRCPLRSYGPEIYDLLVPKVSLRSSGAGPDGCLRVMDLEEMAMKYRSTINELHGYLDRIKTSKSWRFTAPTRWVRRFLGRLIMTRDE